MNKQQFSIDIAGRTLTLEVSDMAKQANAAVLGRYGETAVLATVVMTEKDKNGNYLPLLVDYEEKFYAAGKIIGSRYVRREGRPSEEAILSGRLVDRTIRPLFDQRIRREIQVVVTILAFDGENDPDFVALNAASTALAISDIPWNGPVSGMKIASFNGSFEINPPINKLKNQDQKFEAFFAGPKDRINMIELAGNEAEESVVLQGFETAQKEINKLIEWQNEIKQKIGKSKTQLEFAKPDTELQKKVKDFLIGKLEKAVYQQSKTEYQNQIGRLLHEMTASLDEEDNKTDAEHIFEEELDLLVHKNILEKELRPDSRKLDEVRQLNGEVGLLARTHGSALFSRGDTQSLSITTIAPPGAEQLVETMETTGKRRFLHHYNFPAYSVGEIGSFRGPGRREIGHGALAEKALKAIIPPFDVFPYTIRVVSETLSSNGSSSMASACAASLSMMDAGVPIKKPVGGIAMGLMYETDSNYKIVTDIQGPEDHHGDMDLKVAGTDAGITAIQMDVKIPGITAKIFSDGLNQAKKARLKIIGFIKTVLPEPRPQLSKYAPIVLTIKIDPERIGEVIGPGGKVINGIIAATGGETTIDIEEDGKIFISGPTKELAEEALERVKSIVKTYKLGEMVSGKVVKILDFGAIVEFGNRDGMIHISELKDGYVKTVDEVLKLDEQVQAKIIRLDPDGRIGLSLKAIKNG
ncbi:MAG: polyribonucleotide nucleotidyltransferase [Candidatus Brennerbacteria bacterium]|nr:polyribonucleotide nucleotidyltransferase [Candidatus Brennerbacteria bacterium]